MLYRRFHVEIMADRFFFLLSKLPNLRKKCDIELIIGGIFKLLSKKEIRSVYLYTLRNTKCQIVKVLGMFLILAKIINRFTCDKLGILFWSQRIWRIFSRREFWNMIQNWV